MLLLGHRGARLHAPENTLSAFDVALAHGCDGFEFDVRLTADSRAVICHDATLARCSVARNTHARLVEVCSDLATLDVVLSRFAATAYLYIELKTSGTEDAVLAALAAHSPQRGYVVASFLPEVINAVYVRNSSVPLGYICSSRRLLPCWRTLPVAVVMPHHRLVTPKLIDELHASGKQVFVWTVNQARAMRSLAALRVDAILSDDTELLVRTLRANPRVVAADRHPSS